MLRIIYKLALRNLLHHRSFGLLNILGLSIGISAALLIIMYCIDELSFDAMHPQADQTYRIGYEFSSPNGFNGSSPGGPAGWDNYLTETYPSVTENTGFQIFGMPTSLHHKATDKIIMTEDILWIEDNFQELLAVEPVKGNRDDLLPKINSMVLTESSAEKLFGTNDPIGEIVTVSHMWATDSTEVNLEVTGVVKDFRANNHLQPEFLMNHDVLRQFVENPEQFDNITPGFGEFSEMMFVCSNPEDIETIQEDLQGRVDDFISTNNLDFEYKVLIANLRDLHFDQEVDWSFGSKSADIRYVYVFIAIAIMILAVACINYINLTTARSIRRAKEIGLRKTFGSTRFYLIAQFMMESLLTVLASGFVALVLVLLLLPYFNGITDKDFTFLDIFSWQVLLTFVVTLVLTTVVAGSYPAFSMIRFEPAAVLRGNVKQKSTSGLFRKVLTTLQFAISIMLIAASLIVVKQMGLMVDSKLNESGKQIVSVRYGGFNGPATLQKYQVFKSELLTNPNIQSVTLANHLPRLDYFGPINMHYKLPSLGDEVMRWNRLNGDYDFPVTFDMELIAGRYFEDGNTADSTSFIVNEAAARQLNMRPEELVGMDIWEPLNLNFVGDTDFSNALRGTIVGVVKDFPYQSIYHEIEPLVVVPRPQPMDRIIHVKLMPGNFSAQMDFMESTWRRIYPDFGFDYWFIDDEFNRMYEKETQVAGMTKNFTVLAILLTCFGIYGLSSYMAQRKIKEIGIRKVLGASVGQIVFMLVSTFLILIGIASLISVPLAAFGMSQYWLDGFSYRTPLSLDVILFPSLIIMAISLMTMGWEIIKAARANPVESLKYE